MDKENRMEAIRNLSLTKMEEHYAKRIEELIDDMKLEDAESLVQEIFRLGGNVIEGSIKYSNDMLDISFHLKQGEAILPVTHHSAAVPDLFKDGSQVIVEGTYNKGIFVAENLMTKCASRYEEESGYESMSEKSI